MLHLRLFHHEETSWRLKPFSRKRTSKCKLIMTRPHSWSHSGQQGRHNAGRARFRHAYAKAHTQMSHMHVRADKHSPQTGRQMLEKKLIFSKTFQLLFPCVKKKHAVSWSEKTSDSVSATPDQKTQASPTCSVSCYNQRQQQKKRVKIVSVLRAESPAVSAN